MLYDLKYHTLSYVDHQMMRWAVQFEGKGSYLIYLMRAVLRLCESILAARGEI